jgi:hypothetical protein
MLTLAVVLLSLLLVLVLVTAAALVYTGRVLLQRLGALLQRTETLLAEDGQMVHVLDGLEAVTSMLMIELTSLRPPMTPPTALPKAPRKPRDCP